MEIGKKGQQKGLMWLALGVVAFIVLSQAGILPKLGGGAATPTTTTTTVPTTASNILQTTVSDVTVYFDSYNRYQPNSEITNGNHRVFLCTKSDDCSAYPKNYVDKGYLAEGGSVKAAPGDTVWVAFGLNSTTHYPVVQQKALPSTEGIVNMKAGLAAFDTAPSFTVFRKVGDVMSGTNAQGIQNGDIINLGLRVEATSRTAFGSIDHSGTGNVLCIQYNNSCFDSLKLDGSTFTPTPKVRGTPTGFFTDCYSWKPVSDDPTLAGDNVWTGSLVVDVNNDLNVAAADQCSNVSAFIYDTAVDLNTDTLALITSYQDEVGNDIGQTARHSNTTLFFS